MEGGPSKYKQKGHLRSNTGFFLCGHFLKVFTGIQETTLLFFGGVRRAPRHAESEDRATERLDLLHPWPGDEVQGAEAAEAAEAAEPIGTGESYRNPQKPGFQEPQTSVGIVQGDPRKPGFQDFVHRIKRIPVL